MKLKTIFWKNILKLIQTNWISINIGLKYVKAWYRKNPKLMKNI